MNRNVTLNFLSLKRKFLTIPPPSTEIGIMNSLGDFLIGCLSLVDPIVEDDCINDCVGVVVSESFDSLVD